ncbi:hypothetical protein, partial [Ensifer sp. SSB1]|uniref:hypothetical protein n=1 Tax=Ensifer sp. SSB1 TaxID=2795385 RepID=UPI0025C65A49
VTENQRELVRQKLPEMRTPEWKVLAKATGVPYGTIYNIAYVNRSKDPGYANVYALYTHLKAKRKPYLQRPRSVETPETVVA